MPYIITDHPYNDTLYEMLYKNVATLLVVGIIPLFLLAYWNYNIYRYMKPTPQILSQCVVGQRNSHHQEQELARVLIGIVVTFICCHAVRIFVNFYDALFWHDYFICSHDQYFKLPLWRMIANPINDLMLVINSSANIIIYCCLSSNFRKDLLKCKANQA